MKIYRLLTGGDDAAFCKRVTQALNTGWVLHGEPALTFDTVSERLVCAQAIVKETDMAWSDDMLQESFKLSQQ